MKFDDITIGEARSLVALFQGNDCNKQSSLIGQHVVVRTYSAGVHIGTLVEKDDENVLLKDARRVWKWAGAFTLSELSQHGVSKKESRISCIVPYIELTNANEIIPTSAKARESYEAVHE